MTPCVPGLVTAEDAERLVARVAEDFVPRVTGRVFYPYHRFRHRCSARTLFGEAALEVLCLVDGRTGVAATADPFEIVGLEVSGEVIDSVIGREAARRIARRCVDHVVGRRRKALAASRTEILEEGMVHKPFWIVRCTNGSKPSFRVLVDGVTGGICVLGPSDSEG